MFEERFTGVLKNDIRSLINFHASSRKSENFHFDGLVLSKAYKVLDEKLQKKLYPMTLKNEPKES